MARKVTLPQLGRTMEEGTIVECLVKPGDKVKKGDVIFEFETDKATVELESPADGFVKHILAELGQTLSVGDVVLILGEKDEEISDDFIESLRPAVNTPPAGAVAAFSAPQLTDPVFPKVTPPEPKLGSTIPLSRLQKITGQKMLQSKREIPCFYLTVKADVTELVELRAELNKTSDVEISYNDFIMRAAALGLEKFPAMTGRLSGGQIQLSEAIDIGLAISVPAGLVAPVVRDVHKKDIRQIACASRRLIEKARADKLSLSDLQGGCITISNLGSFGVDSFTAIVVPGQCSILGVGRITDICVPSDGGITVGRSMSLTLSADHRIANGTYASQFLDFVRKLLEEPSSFT